VYQYVTGRFGLNADLVGVHSGVTALIDQGGPSCMTLPGFRQFIVEPARSRVYAFLSAYLVGGLEGHFIRALPTRLPGSSMPPYGRPGKTPTLVKGIKAHAELGGFARWGIEVMRLCAHWQGS
jgi:dihydroorotase